MKRILHNFKLWEDHKNGQYEKRDGTKENMLSSFNLLSDRSLLEKAMRRVINEWKFSTEENLTNLGINRKAWLGQAACCLSHGANEWETIDAWNVMSYEKQVIANGVAMYIINEFEEGLLCQKNTQIKMF